MDVSKLEVGQVYSYKQLCDLTGAEYKSGGNSKKAQLEKYGEVGFHRFFDFDKIGRDKYLISEVFDEELPIEDKRHDGNHAVYSTYIELILMNYLYKKGTHSEVLTKRGLWELLGMINKNYRKASKEDLKMIDSSITNYEINQFYMRSARKLDKILSSALNNLRNRKLIELEYQTVVCTNKNGNEIWFVANEDEKRYLLHVEHDALIKLGLSKYIQVVSKGIQSEYYNLIYQKIYEDKKWKQYYRRYKIIFNAKDIQRSIPEVEFELKKQLLNNEIVKYLDDEAQRLFDANKEKCDTALSEAVRTGQNIGAAMSMFRFPDDYMIAQKLLTDELIKLGGNNRRVTFMQMVQKAMEEEKFEDLPLM